MHYDKTVFTLSAHGFTTVWPDHAAVWGLDCWISGFFNRFSWVMTYLRPKWSFGELGKNKSDKDNLVLL